MTTRNLLVWLAGLCLLPACERQSPSAPDQATMSLRFLRDATAGAADDGMVHILGPTQMTVAISPGTTKTITGLQPGTYTVALEALSSAERPIAPEPCCVASYGETAGITVNAGHDTPVTLTLGSFAPTLASLPSTVVVGQSLVVSYSLVAYATSYWVERSSNPDFSFAIADKVTGSPFLFLVDQSGPIFVRVRAVDRFGTVGLASSTGASTGTQVPAVLRQEALNAFALAFSGGNTQEGLVLLDGLLADEWLSSGPSAAQREVDQRSVTLTNTSVATVFRNLHRSRLAADFAAQRMAIDAPTDPGLPEMQALSAYTWLLFAEDFCSGVPFSRIDSQHTITAGPALTTTEMLDTALARFATVRLNSTSGTQAWLLATLGSARAYQGLGQFAGLSDFQNAAAAAQQVPDVFEYTVAHTNNPVEKSNAIYVLNTVAKQYSLADQEGGNGLAFRSANDPRRVPWLRQPPNNLGADNLTPQFDLLKYADRSAGVVLASGLEARLIEAETLARTGNTTGAAVKLNQLRVAAGLAPLPGNATLSDVLRERAFFVFATGHRTGDLRRTNGLFPAGAYPKGGSYGSQTALPIPVEPENNPAGLRCLASS